MSKYYRSSCIVIACAMCALAASFVLPIRPARAVRTTFPARFYPLPAHPRFQWGLGSLCASPKNTASPVGVAKIPALSALAAIRGHVRSDKRFADRAFWPMLRNDAHRLFGPNGSLVRVGPADTHVGPGDTAGSLAALVRSNCGTLILKRSLLVVTAPRRPGGFRKEPALVNRFLMINRDGRWLLWLED